MNFQICHLHTDKERARDRRLPFPTENVCMELGFSSPIVAAHSMHVAKFIDTLWHAIAREGKPFSDVCSSNNSKAGDLQFINNFISLPDSCCCMHPKSSVHDKLQSVSFIASGGQVVAWTHKCQPHVLFISLSPVSTTSFATETAFVSHITLLSHFSDACFFFASEYCKNTFPACLST